MLTILFKQFGQLSLAVFTFSLVLPAVSAQQATSGSAVSPVPVTVTKTVTVCSHRPHSTFITSRKHHTEKSSSPTTTSSPNTSITSHTVSPASSCTSTPSVTTDGYTLTGFVEIKPTVTLDSYEVAPRVVMGHRITYTDYDVATDMRAYVENACQFQCVAFCRSFSVYYRKSLFGRSAIGVPIEVGN